MNSVQSIVDHIVEEIREGHLGRYGLNRIINPEVLPESPLEQALEQSLVKYLCATATVTRQFKIPTFRGIFRIDLVVQTDDALIGFECDGKQYHDWSRDIFRDAIILENSEIAAIYRLQGPDIYYRLETALFLIARMLPNVFSERGLDNLWTLSECRDDLEVERDEDGISGFYRFTDEDGKSSERTIRIRRLSRKHHDFPLMSELASKFKSVPLNELWSVLLREQLKSHSRLTEPP